MGKIGRHPHPTYPSKSLDELQTLLATLPRTRNGSPPRPMERQSTATPLTETQLQEMVDAYRDGMPMKVPAANYQVDTRRVPMLLRERGVTIRRQLPNSEQIKQATALYADGASVATIASKLGLSPARSTHACGISAVPIVREVVQRPDRPKQLFRRASAAQAQLGLNDGPLELRQLPPDILQLHIDSDSHQLAQVRFGSSNAASGEPLRSPARPMRGLLHLFDDRRDYEQVRQDLPKHLARSLRQGRVSSNPIPPIRQRLFVIHSQDWSIEVVQSDLRRVAHIAEFTCIPFEPVEPQRPTQL